MKRTVLLLLSLIVSMMAMADGITADQAEEIARQFVNRQHPAAQGKRMMMAAKRQLPVSVAADANAYYVFNVGSDNGYVMVSGSDLTPQVLGYASEGSFDVENIPANMKAWLDGYAEQIAYVERTKGRNQAPMLRISREAVSPLLTTTWNQDAPYNIICPMANGVQSPTGCVATALAQVINYHKYPARTTKAIPAYTTATYNISMPEIPVTDIDWANMLDDYRGGETTSEKNAVAKLMLLCGQSVEMDYCDSYSGALTSECAEALRQYFGYDETVRKLDRENFTTSEWESIIYDEVANNRPLLYSGYSTGGGHAFVVDGYGSDGLFHVNWGWGGNDNGYYRLSVLNPYNNEDIGTSSSDDGFSFSQNVVVGIQHGTGEKIAGRLSVTEFINKGTSSYTRTSIADNFSGMSFSTSVYNCTGVRGEFWIRLALVDAKGGFVEWVSNKTYYSGFLENDYGADLSFADVSFGANLNFGNYYIVPMNTTSEDLEEWLPCYGADFYRIKATFRGETLTLTEPSVNLNASFSPVDNAEVFTTVNVQAQITNNGTDFNNYIFLFVDNTLVGGRMFEVKAGKTATFDIDFMPKTPGTKTLKLFYVKDPYLPTEEYVSIGTGIITITGEDGDPLLEGSITLTNANSMNVVNETIVNVSAEIQNVGNGAFVDGWIAVYLYKRDIEMQKWYSVDKSYKVVTIGSGSHVSLKTSFEGLEFGGIYRIVVYYKPDGGTYTLVNGTDEYFDVVDPSSPTPVITGNIKLTNDNANGDIEGTTATAEYTFQNTGNAALENGGLWLELYKIDSSGKSEFVKYKGEHLSLGIGESQTLTDSFDNLEIGGKYYLILTYNIENSMNYRPIDNTAVYFNVVEEGSGIDTLPSGDQSFDVYSVAGVKVRSQSTSLKGLPHGVYIINKKKVLK